MFSICTALEQTILTFSGSREEGFGKTVEKGENGGKQYFRLFPQTFLLYEREKSSFYERLICHPQMHSIWSHAKFCRLVKS